MKKYLSVIPLVLPFCLFVGCQDKGTTAGPEEMTAQSDDDVAEAKQEIERVIRQNEVSLLNNDIEVLENNWSDQYILTIPTGKRYTKSEMIARLKSGEVEYLDINGADTEIRISRDTAVVTGQIISKIKLRGEELSLLPARFTGTFVKRDGRWQIMARHECQIEQ